jgi:hypothetical protein
MEFRCFVRSGKLVGISQRDHTNFYPAVAHGGEAIKTDIVHFFNSRIRGRFSRENYTFDVYRKGEGSVMLVDFNPLSPVTDALLFEWSELLPNADVAAAEPGPTLPAHGDGAPALVKGGAMEETPSVEENPGSVKGDSESDAATVSVASNAADAAAAAEKITLTDKLNKALLLSFLDRINDPGSGIPTYDSDDGDWPEETADDLAHEAKVYEMLSAAAKARGGDGAAAAVAPPAPTMAAPSIVAGATASTAETPGAEVDFRIVLSQDHVRMRPSVFIDSRVPRDILDISSAADIERLATLYRRRELGQDDSESEDDGTADT